MGRSGVDDRSGDNSNTYLHNRTTVKQIGTTYGFSKLKNNIRNDVVF